MSGRDRADIAWGDEKYRAAMNERESEMGAGTLYSVVIRRDNTLASGGWAVVVATSNFRTPATAWRAALGQLATHVYRTTTEG
jgi:hypothetical protein